MFARIFIGADGRSRFEGLDALPPGLKVTLPQATSDIKFRRGLDDYEWHNPAGPRYVITLSGTLEMECESGNKRLLRAGDVILHEDYTGKGHRSRMIGGELWTAAIIPLK